MEASLEELQGGWASQAADDIVFLRAQVDFDFSRCMSAVAKLETTFKEHCVDKADGDESCVSKGGAASSTPGRKIDLTIDLESFNPMQRGLFKQIGGMLNTLVMEKRTKHLEELRQNVSSQCDGPAKEQQLRVVEALERQLQG